MGVLYIPRSCNLFGVEIGCLDKYKTLVVESYMINNKSGFINGPESPPRGYAHHPKEPQPRRPKTYRLECLELARWGVIIGDTKIGT